MATNGGRIPCPKCGANNFDTVSACWKCSASLVSGGSSLPISQQTFPTQPVYASQTPPIYPTQVPQVYANAAPPMLNQERNPVYQPMAQQSYRPDDGDPKMAKRAALLLAWTLPFFGLPIGWTLMMIQNRQRQEIGRFCATWSLVAFLVHTILFGILAAGSTPLLMKILVPILEAQSKGSSGGSGATPNIGGGEVGQ